MSKQLVFIIGPAHPLRGGLATFNQRLVKAFYDSGYDAEIYSYSLQYPSVFFPGKSQFTDDPAPEQIIIHTALNSVNPFNWLRVGSRIRKRKPDIIIFRYWMPFFAPCLGSIARIIHRNKHTHILAITDNVIPHESRIGDKILTRYFLKSMDGFITMSEAVKKQLLGFVKNKPVLYNPHPLYDNFGAPIPINEAKAALELSNELHYILFFGFIREYKGLDILIEAMLDDRLKKMPLHLLVVGEFYDNEEKYRKSVAANNLQNQITFVDDFVPDSEVSKYFSAAELVVQPYKNATQSGVTQIAYHFDKPMVVTRVGALPEMVPDNKVGYVTDVNAHAVAEAIFDFFEKDRSQEFISNIKEEKKKYSWITFLKNIERLVQE